MRNRLSPHFADDSIHFSLLHH